MPCSSEFRIISLVPSLTDLCFSLGIGGSVVGRTDYCISPAEHMPNIPSVGGPQSVDPEKFRLLAPTHVLISPEENKPDILPLIEECNAQAVLVDPHCPEDNADIFQKFGNTFKCAEQATQLVEQLNANIKAAHALRDTTTLICVLPLIWKDPWISTSAPTYAARMLEAVGITVPEFETADRYPNIPKPEALAPHPDAIALMTEPYSFTEAHSKEVSEAFDCPNVFVLQGETLAWYGSYAIPALKTLMHFKEKTLDALNKNT